jgi:hypothetical protein
MNHRLVMQGILAGVLLAGAVTGCHKPAIREKPVPDPLLTSKKPIAGRTMSTNGHSPGGENLSPPPPPPGADFLVPRSEGTIVRMLGPR